MKRNPAAGGGGSTRPKRDDPRPPQLGMPFRGDPMNGIGKPFPQVGGAGPQPGMGGGQQQRPPIGGGPPPPRPGGGQPQGFDMNSFRVGKGGQLSVGTKDGGRSWLGQAESDEGSLVPMGKADNGYMQFGRVPIGNSFNVDPSSQGTPYALEGGPRAGFANNFSWDPKGGANSKAWRNMLGTGGYETYGQPTGVFAQPQMDWGATRANYGIPDPSTQEQYQGAPRAGRTRRTNTFGQVRY
jgi:hypothetical protein